MKLLVTGSHQVSSYEQVQTAIEELVTQVPYYGPITTIVSGRDRPPALLAERWAQAHHIPVETVTEDPSVPGQAVPYVRGVDMLNAAQVILVVRTKGSQDCQNLLSMADKLLKPAYVVEI